MESIVTFRDLVIDILMTLYPFPFVAKKNVNKPILRFWNGEKVIPTLPARVALSSWPTPIESMPRFSDALGGPAISIKRDDVGSIGLGGNKLRKLEFFIADALAQGCDTLITSGALQSNHARLTAAAAARSQLECHLVLKDQVRWEEASYRRGGNLLLDGLLGASIEVVSPDGSMADAVAAAFERLVSEGRKAYVVPLGGSDRLGSLGYVKCAEEIASQPSSDGKPWTHIVVASGSGGTQAGLTLGCEIYGLEAQVVGMSISREPQTQAQIVSNLLRETGSGLGLAEEACGRVQVEDGCYLPGYGLPHSEMGEVVRLCCTKEGVFLDPVYTGKAMAGLIRLIKQGTLTSRDRVLFVHTGGTPAIFAYDDFFRDWPA